MIDPLILFTSLLAGLAAAGAMWFGIDLVQKLQHVGAQRRMARALAAAEAAAAAAEEARKDAPPG